MVITLDCTLRDGGYINNWRFSKDFINEYINTMENLNIDYVEVGFINKTNKYKEDLVGNLRLLNEEELFLFQNKKFKTAIMGDYEDINLEILKKKINIDLVRIAFHKKDLVNALNVCKEIKDLGYSVSVNAMAITNYENDDLNYLFKFINDYKLDIIYIADSYGSLNQKKIKEYYNLFSKNLETTSIGFHLHNNMNNAFSNFEYLNNSVLNNQKNTIFIDSTLFGMGRGAGNLQTELVFINLNEDTNIDILIKLFIFIHEYIKPIYNRYDNSWGYELDYLLSGYLKMHPNFVVKLRELNISMKNRFFLIKKIKEKYNYKLFDKNIINELIKEYKQQLL